MSLQLNVPATEEWVYFPPRTSNELPPHVLGTAEWYPIGTEGHGTYRVREDFLSGRFEYQFCKFINDTWFITQWNEEHLAFRTHQGLRLSLDIQRQAGLGYGISLTHSITPTSHPKSGPLHQDHMDYELNQRPLAQEVNQKLTPQRNRNHNQEEQTPTQKPH